MAANVRLFFKKAIQYPSFSKDQTEILKGCGIILIVLHNFFHNLTPFIGENEFSFDAQFFWNLYETLRYSPLEFFRAFFSYFGHYGVQIFIFFSAYGLTRKYCNKKLIYSDFLVGRLFKIYLSFIVCLLLYIILGNLKSTFLVNEKVLYWDSLLWKALLVSNFIPGQALMPVGPWWFLPFIFQFYLIYPILLKFYHYQKYGDWFLCIISLLFILVEGYLNPLLISKNLNLNHMVFGHLPVICIGLYCGSKNKINIPLWVVILAITIFILSNFNKYFWLLSDSAFIIVFLIVYLLVSNIRFQSNAIKSIFIFFGKISFYLFMVNGFLRTPFHHFAETYHVWWIDNLSALASLLFSTLFAFMLKQIDSKLRVGVNRMINNTG